MTVTDTPAIPGTRPHRALTREVLRRCWHPVAFADQVTDRPSSLQLLGEHLMLRRVADGVTVTQRYCPHRNADLCDGVTDGGNITCAYHGWTFDGAGRCVDIPTEGPGAPISPKAHLRSYRCEVRHNLVWVLLDDDPLSEIPDWPEADDPDYRFYHADPVPIDTSAGRLLENFLDVSHFPFVHTDTFGDTTMPKATPFEVHRDDAGLTFHYSYLAANPDTSSVAGAAHVQREMLYQLEPPFSGRLVIEYDQGRHVIMLAIRPVTETSSEVLFSFARNFDHHRRVEELIAWDLAIFEEDRTILEHQHPKELPLDVENSMHVRSDRGTVQYRLALRTLIERHHAAPGL
ncbi:aromatic ring-hydroxylating oxygenase subunit alpha [Pseudonocardia nigra]|uniref:aromatic ring-hydroxylating oxygenase subunit alpha n=1 Tax=Pseudonocardia nigra TaxID=1921578 RepID=UPI001C5DA944|nr:aromatic ring-hydroxylating dioxygenase subunit alpha [Pseudonocardia nigra]